MTAPRLGLTASVALLVLCGSNGNTGNSKSFGSGVGNANRWSLQ
ncbi:MAG TPA: hypothetical protein VGO94_12330 [Mycobacteriales bacterium]|nr:hypothetical protein [Mycobacteriales bacterium]